MDELVLRTIVIQFDGRVVEVFEVPIGEVIRHHVAILDVPKVSEPDGKGRKKITIGRAIFKVAPDEFRRLEPLIEKISAAVRAAKGGVAGADRPGPEGTVEPAAAGPGGGA